MKNLLFCAILLFPAYSYSQVTDGLEKVMQIGGNFVFPSAQDGQIQVSQVGPTYTIRWYKDEYFQLEYNSDKVTSFLKEQAGCKCMKSYSDPTLQSLLESKLDSISKGQIIQPAPLLAGTDTTSLSLKKLLEGPSLMEREGKIILWEERITVFIIRVATGETSSYDIILYKGRPWESGIYLDNMIPNAPAVPLTWEWLHQNLFK